MKVRKKKKTALIKMPHGGALRTPWKPGQSGNPKGRPVGSGSIITWVKERLRGKPYKKKNFETLSHEIADRLLRMARAGQLSAIQTVIDRTESRSITEEEMQREVDRVYGIVKRHVKDRKVLAAISRDLRTTKNV